MQEMQEDPYSQGGEFLNWEESKKKNYKYEKSNCAWTLEDLKKSLS